MIIDLNKQIENIFGDPMQTNEGIATVRSTAITSLLDSSSSNYEEKIKLAKRIKDADDAQMNLHVEDVALIKKSAKELGFSAQFLFQFERAIDSTDGEPYSDGKEAKGKEE